MKTPEVDIEIKRIFKVGGSIVVTIPKKFLESHGLKPGDKVKVFYDDMIHIVPIQKEEIVKRVEKAKEIILGGEQHE